ncbi:hypothetical protein OSB04_030549 [Centaurea solstitialis]|uniref:Uncharacterized protein n=1 Tax=Centaurea solstitialis TaxID=347529 RepID=A0AA38W796_9ASTR|nr:hypothetical protein OSB04_030549 [Centaurea solstitialis]
MSTVGFDFRNERCVVAVSKHSSIVCFDEEQCFLGVSGAATNTPNPKNSILLIMRSIIGRPFADLELQQDLQALPFSVTEGPDGFPLIHARYSCETKSFTPIQILGMVFSNMKRLAEMNLNASVVDCCIGIPVYFTDLQRRAVLEVAKIAGLNPVKLMHETTATALAYGMYETDLSENKQRNVAFVDIGRDSMQVCIAAFKEGEMKILAHSFDRSVGGRDFDEVLFHSFAEQLKSRYKIDAFQHAIACSKLRDACEKLKEVLRSNPEALLYVECLIDDKYVRGYMKRDEFEQITTPIVERVKKPLEEALLDAKFTVDDIYSVEVVGSESRVPAIINILTKFFGKEPMRTMNANECVSRGCALECARLSSNFKVKDLRKECDKGCVLDCAFFNPLFQVKEFQVQESFPFPIALQWKGPTQDSDNGKTENQSCLVFSKGNLIPSVKALTFYRTGTFNVDVLYADARELQAPSKISTFTAVTSRTHFDEVFRIHTGIRLILGNHGPT